MGVLYVGGAVLAKTLTFIHPGDYCKNKLVALKPKVPEIVQWGKWVARSIPHPLLKHPVPEYKASVNRWDRRKGWINIKHFPSSNHRMPWYSLNLKKKKNFRIGQCGERVTCYNHCTIARAIPFSIGSSVPTVLSRMNDAKVLTNKVPPTPWTY